MSLTTDEPLDRQTQRGRLKITFAYYTAFIILGLASASFGPTLPGIAAHVRSSIGQVSALFVMRSLGYLIGSLLAGRAYDRVKSGPLIVTVILLMASIMALVPLIPVLWMMGGVLLLLGTVSGLLDVGVNTMLVWVHRERVGPFMNGLHFFYGLGAFFSPIIIAQAVLRSGDIYWAYWALALLMLPPTLLLSRQPSPTAITATASAPTRPAVPLLIALITLFDFFYVGAEVSYGGWVYTYAITLGLGSPAVAAYLTSGFWGAITAARLLSIPLAARFPAHKILIVDLLLVLSGLAVIQLMPGSFTAMWAGTILVGLGMASIFPTVLILAGQRMTITGKVTSWFFAGSSLGSMFLPWIIGQLFEPVGPRVTMLAITTNVVIAAVLFFLIVFYAARMTDARQPAPGE